MNYIQKLGVLTFAVLCFAAVGATAQIGHINSQVVFADMPATQSAKSQLEAHSKQLGEDLTAKETKLQQKVESARKTAGDMTANQIKTLETEIQNEAMAIDKTRQEYQQKVYEKENELMKPLVDKFQSSIESVAKANGYKFILDSSALLYADPNADITTKVKSKLN